MIRETPFQRYLLTLRILFTLILCAAVVFYVDKSIHWQVMWDTSIMHYVNFLIAHGLAPYRDIVDINLPGSYFMEGLAMHIFGGGDLGWRLYDYTLLLILIVSLIVIAWPYDWFAGLFAGVFFLVIHGSEGALNAGQREELMTTLIVAAYALLFGSMRCRKPLLLLPFGALLGIAASLKPTSAPLGLMLLLMAAIGLRKRSLKITPYLAYGFIGMLLASLTSIGFLYRYHAFHAFVVIFKRLAPYYASVGNTPKHQLLGVLLHRKYCLIAAIGVPLLFANKAENSWENWERIALCVGIAFGIFSYIAQGKPFDHHAYSFVVFITILASIEFVKALKKSTWIHLVALSCISLGVLDVMSSMTFKTTQGDTLTAELNAENDALKDDLTRLGGSGLQHQVQCFDMVSSCFATQYRLRLMPYTTFMGDYMFFGPRGKPPLPYYRTIMWDQLQRNPPQVIVLTNQWMARIFLSINLTSGPSFPRS